MEKINSINHHVNIIQLQVSLKLKKQLVQQIKVAYELVTVPYIFDKRYVNHLLI